jgi:hypothetical protein
LQIKTKIVNCHTADSKPVKQEVNGTVILPSLVFPAFCYGRLAKGLRIGNVRPLKASSVKRRNFLGSGQAILFSQLVFKFLNLNFLFRFVLPSASYQYLPIPNNTKQYLTNLVSPGIEKASSITANTIPVS